MRRITEMTAIESVEVSSEVSPVARRSLSASMSFVSRDVTRPDV